MKKSTVKHSIASTLLLAGLPAITHAQAFKNFAGDFVLLLNQFVYVIMGFALVFFLFGVVRFIASAGDDQSREQGKQLMVWGTISLFVMTAVWGLVTILHDSFFS